MQVRYGWTDEIIHGLLFARFVQLVQLSINAQNKEGKERLVLASYIGWQMGAGDKKTFQEYLAKMGLSEELPHQSEEATDAALARMGIMEEKR